MGSEDISTIIESVFLDALDLPESQREEFLANACRGDAALRQRVEALLRSVSPGGRGDGAATDFLHRAAGLALLATATEALPIRLGRYDLLRRVGEGSFGVVYHAAQRTPVRRDVAVKVVRPGLE